MSNIPITSLPIANPLSGEESVPLVQAGTTKRTTSGAISALPFGQGTSFASGISFITVTTSSAVLPSSRVLAAASPVTLTDNGTSNTLVVGLSFTPGSGTVTSVGLSGGSTGLTVSGSPVTVSGTMTLGGFLTGTAIATNSVTFSQIQQMAGLSVAGVSGAATANIGPLIGSAAQGLAVNAAGTLLGFTASPTYGTSVTTPLITGGTAASSTLTLESTSASGTSDRINLKTGTATHWNINTLGTLTGTTQAGTTAPGIVISQRPSGTHVNNSYNLIHVVSDDVNTGDGSFSVGLNVDHTFGGSAMTGGREAIQGRAVLSARSNASNTNRNYVGVMGIAVATSSDGGTNTGTGSLGSIFGIGAWGDAQANATALVHVTGGELDVSLRSGSTARHKTGLTITSHPLDAVNAADTNAGLAISTQAGGIGFRHGLLFGPFAGLAPIHSTGTVLGVSGLGTVARGIDLAGYTCTLSAFRSTGFSVNALGVTSVANSTSVGGPSGISITVNQIQSNAGDTTDSALRLAYSLSTASATNELVTRVFSLAATNNLTGGGSIQNLRVIDQNIAVNANTTTDEAAAFYLSATGTGAVTNAYGMFINNLPDAATNKWGLFDGSGGNEFTAGRYIAKGTAAIPAGGTSAITFSTTSTFGVYFGSGAPSVSAPQGSLYLRSDGNSTTTRGYINSSGTGTWVAIVTVA